MFESIKAFVERTKKSYADWGRFEVEVHDAVPIKTRQITNPFNSVTLTFGLYESDGFPIETPKNKETGVIPYGTQYAIRGYNIYGISEWSFISLKIDPEDSKRAFPHMGPDGAESSADEMKERQIRIPARLDYTLKDILTQLIFGRYKKNTDLNTTDYFPPSESAEVSVVILPSHERTKRRIESLVDSYDITVCGDLYVLGILDYFENLRKRIDKLPQRRLLGIEFSDYIIGNSLSDHISIGERYLYYTPISQVTQIAEELIRIKYAWPSISASNNARVEEILRYRPKMQEYLLQLIEIINGLKKEYDLKCSDFCRKEAERMEELVVPFRSMVEKRKTRAIKDTRQQQDQLESILRKLAKSS